MDLDLAKLRLALFIAIEVAATQAHRRQRPVRFDVYGEKRVSGEVHPNGHVVYFEGGSS